MLAPKQARAMNKVNDTNVMTRSAVGTASVKEKINDSISEMTAMPMIAFDARA
jgi:hypothetical protein